MKVKLLLFNIFLLAFYFLMLHFFGFPAAVNEKMFSSPDSRDYQAMGNWIFGLNPVCSPVRPFLYPLIQHIAQAAGGLFGIWFLQFALYIVSVNLVFFSVMKSTGRRGLAGLSAFLLATNISFLVLTLHGLTEVTAVFILSLFVYYVTHHIADRKSFTFLCTLIFFAAILAVIKPLFNLLFLFLVLIVFPMGYLKAYRDGKFALLKLVIAVVPWLVQVGIMKQNFNTFSVSKIGEVTLKYYYYKRLVGNVNHVGIDAGEGADSTQVAFVQHQIKDANSAGIMHYMLQHPREAWSTYWSIVPGNINAGSEFTTPNRYFSFGKWAKNVNNIYYLLHILFIPLMVLAFYKMKKKSKEDRTIIVLTGVPLYFILFTSGISFWQGDRLVLPALPLFLTLYPFVATRFRR